MLTIQQGIVVWIIFLEPTPTTEILSVLKNFAHSQHLNNIVHKWSGRRLHKTSTIFTTWFPHGNNIGWARRECCPFSKTPPPNNALSHHRSYAWWWPHIGPPWRASSVPRIGPNLSYRTRRYTIFTLYTDLTLNRTDIASRSMMKRSRFFLQLRHRRHLSR